ncbi:uncharacterized protein LOC142585148 isoform X1 [Dermacentor variabilis]|uniref:uncharacterized protein LOC142585148 isoform X1 n=1 Tax=Dermacentor variabilis TaxID=34621 RepID=UPI003F5B9409
MAVKASSALLKEARRRPERPLDRTPGCRQGTSASRLGRHPLPVERGAQPGGGRSFRRPVRGEFCAAHRHDNIHHSAPEGFKGTLQESVRNFQPGKSHWMDASLSVSVRSRRESARSKSWTTCYIKKVPSAHMFTSTQSDSVF